MYFFHGVAKEGTIGVAEKKAKKKNENESKFLKAIEKYARQQQMALQTETEVFEKEALQKAERDGLRDAQSLINKERTAMRAKISADMAKKEADGNLEIFKTRQRMTAEIFEKASEKLRNYTATPDYEKKLLAYARECAEFFGKADVEVCLCKRDIPLAEKITAIFGAGCTVKEVADIRIGGLRAYCPQQQIAVDKTFDTQLEQQKEWFYEHSDLKVKPE